MKIYLPMLLSLSLLACGQTEKPQNTADNQPKTASSQPVNEVQNKKSENESLSVNNVFIKASLPGQKVSSAYFTLKNSQDKDIEIKDIHTNVANITEFHTMEMQNSKMVMRKMENVTVPANGALTLSPGADHVMLIQLKQPLKADDKVSFTLNLADGQTLEFSGMVAKEDSHDDHEHHHEHDHQNEQHDHHEHQHEHEHKH